jgi:hypothetical protein
MKNQEALRIFVFVLHRSAIKIHARTHARTHTHTHTHTHTQDYDTSFLLRERYSVEPMYNL